MEGRGKKTEEAIQNTDEIVAGKLKVVGMMGDTWMDLKRRSKRRNKDFWGSSGDIESDADHNTPINTQMERSCLLALCSKALNVHLRRLCSTIPGRGTDSPTWPWSSPIDCKLSKNKEKNTERSVRFERETKFTFCASTRSGCVWDMKMKRRFLSQHRRWRRIESAEAGLILKRDWSECSQSGTGCGEKESTLSTGAAAPAESWHLKTTLTLQRQHGSRHGSSRRESLRIWVHHRLSWTEISAIIDFGRRIFTR